MKLSEEATLRTPLEGHEEDPVFGPSISWLADQRDLRLREWSGGRGRSMGGVEGIPITQRRIGEGEIGAEREERMRGKVGGRVGKGRDWC